jgi:MFS family permease
MSTTPAGVTDDAAETRAFAWFHTLGARGKRAFVGAFGGYALDSYDYQVLPLGLVAITAYFHLTTGQAGLLATTTLVLSAVGGALAGILADRIGRVRTLLITVATYAVFTVACGFATSYEMLLVFRALQGLGFGGEWAAGAVLVAEYCRPRYRGRTLAFVQSAWAVGWGLSVLVYTLVFQLLDDAVAWRVLFWTGALPALLILWIRRSVRDAPETERSLSERADGTERSLSERADGTEARRDGDAERGSFRTLFRGPLLRTTLFASLLATGVQGGYYALFTWLPTFLKTERGLTVIGTGGYLFFLITGAFAGYVTGGYVTDRLGRKRTFVLFAVASALLVIAYTAIPPGANTVILFLGFPLGFCASAIFSGFGAYLAELYPTVVRGTGQGFTYNFGRGVGALFPAGIGFAAQTMGVGGAMVFAAAAYGIAVLALLGLPETVGTELT